MEITSRSPVFSFFFKFSWRDTFMQDFIKLWLVSQEIGVFQQNQFVPDKWWSHQNDYVTRAYISTFLKFLDDILTSWHNTFIEIEFVIWKKSVGRGPFSSANPGSNKKLKIPGQIELNVNFIYSEMSINCFSREQLPSLIYVGLYVLSLRRFYFLPTFSCHDSA